MDIQLGAGGRSHLHPSAGHIAFRLQHSMVFLAGGA